jgi:purine-nucleoside phosphorylase
MSGRRVVVLAGRVHAYEGHDPLAVTFGVRVLGLLGAAVVVLTNASGGINGALAPGMLMIIDDHLNLTGMNPLVGPNDERFGARFPDMTEVYARRLRDIADDTARAAGTRLPHGVYAGVVGPSYETPAEIRGLAAIGADVVGMSTVLEAIAARHMGLEVLGVSCVSNRAAGLARRPLDHRDVLETARLAESRLASLLEGVVARL